jgi:phosphatidylglycerophosphatase A
MGARGVKDLNTCLMSEPQSDTLNLRECFRKADLFEKLALCLSLWFGAGLMPKAPGTFGTLAAVPLALAVKELGVFYEGLFLVIFVSIAIWASGLSEKRLGRNDPPEVVIDEVAGFLLTLFLLPSSWLTLSFGFILFRLIDIVKPFPIKRLEKSVKGGTGVVLDDLLAAVYANLGVRVLLLIF